MTVGSKRVMAAAGASVVALVVLAGCTGSDPAPTVSSASIAPTSSASPTTSATSAAPTTSATDGIPAAAKTKTPAGALAFVQFFNSELNRAWTAPDSSVLPKLCLPTSAACSEFQDGATELVQKKQRLDRPSGIYKSVTSIGPAADGSLRFSVKGQQQAYKVVNADGSVVTTGEATPLVLVYYVVWQSDGWRIKEIKQGK